MEMYTIIGILVGSLVLLLVIYSKLYGNFRRISRERNDLLSKYLKSHYASCNLLRTMNVDYINFINLLDETAEFVEDAGLKKEMKAFRNNLARIQKNKLEKDLTEVEQFMTDYEIHQLTHGE
jgi:uncharacterized membrane protein YgaE (UPF0421/DUF939 family)